MKSFSFIKLMLGVFLVLGIVGCTKPNKTTPNNSKFSQEMTSSQVEKALDWKYCETTPY